MRDQYKVLAEKYNLVTESSVLSREEKIKAAALDIYNELYYMPDGPEFIRYLVIHVWDGDETYFDDIVPNIAVEDVEANKITQQIITVLYDYYFNGTAWGNIESKTTRELLKWYESFKKHLQAKKSLEQQNKDTGINLDI